MALLKELLNLGLIEIGHDDALYSKLEESVNELADYYVKKPKLLIQATILSLDTAAPSSEPVFESAKEIVSGQWHTFANKFRDDPRTILRLLIFCALHKAAQDNDEIKAVLWLTARNQLEFLSLGREGEVILKALNEMGEDVEDWLSDQFEGSSLEPQQPSLNFNFKFEDTTLQKDAPTAFMSAVGPQNNAGANPEPNPHWANGNAAWVTELGPRMAKAVVLVVNHSLKQFSKKLLDTVQANFAEAASSIGKVIAEAEQNRTAEKTQIKSLWWSQALYSSNLRKSYRELPKIVVPMAMAVDLHKDAGCPTPVSMSYLLSETVRKVLDSTSLEDITLEKILVEIMASKELSSLVIDEPFYDEGRFTLLNIISTTLAKNENPVSILKSHSSIPTTAKTNLSRFAASVYRDLQAQALSEQLEQQVEEPVVEVKKGK